MDDPVIEPSGVKDPTGSVYPQHSLTKPFFAREFTVDSSHALTPSMPPSRPPSLAEVVRALQMATTALWCA